MSKLRVHRFSISIDGFGAGPDQDLPESARSWRAQQENDHPLPQGVLTQVGFANKPPHEPLAHFRRHHLAAFPTAPGIGIVLSFPSSFAVLGFL